MTAAALRTRAVFGGRTLVASDWHLGHFSPPGAARLAIAFLERALASEDDVILNGDIFEGLFETTRQAEAAQPAVCALIEELTARGRLHRTEGNHDPGSGAPAIVLDHPALGRILVTHGHRADAIQQTLPLRVGDAISRRFGRLALVRGAARLAESTAALAAGRVDAAFRHRCLALVHAADCTFGVFGHVHRSHLSAGDPYANAGRLRATRLEYLVLGPHSAELARLDPCSRG